MPKAARANDTHACTLSEPAPHVGGPIQEPASPDVEVDHAAQARAGDRAICTGSPAPDFVVTGSGTVWINNQPAARVTDKTMHGGAVMVGSGTVDIGGPTVGITLGAMKKGKDICQNMAAGRNPPPNTVYPASTGAAAGQPILAGTLHQSYSNCSIESARQIINQVNKPVTQEQLLNQAMDHGLAKRAPNLYDSGGSYPDQSAALLGLNGVPAHTERAIMENLQQAVAENRGVIATLMAGTLSGRSPGIGAHAVLVTGVEYDGHGQLKNVIINDTGQGTCGQSIPVSTFAQAVYDYNDAPFKLPFFKPITAFVEDGLIVTDKPIW